jgi:hypothetical protein
MACSQPVEATLPPLPPPPPPPSPPVLPISFHSRFRDRPAYNLGPINIECEDYSIRHWISEAITNTNQKFELYYKKKDIIIDELQAPLSFLQALFKGDNPQAYSFH